MGLDYTSGCVNFRDVGGYLNLIVGKKRYRENTLFRGGSIDHVSRTREIGNPKTIISLRNGQDVHQFDCLYLHFPMANKVEKYDTAQKEVRRWLNQILQTFLNETLNFPVLIHCLSGKDRTGIVVAAILHLLDVPVEVIIEEYLLSEGEVKKELIIQAIEGFRNHQIYFNRIDKRLFKERIGSVFLV